MGDNLGPALGEPLLHLAARAGLEYVQALERLGAPYTANEYGVTPLDVAQSGVRDARVAQHWTGVH